MEALSSPAAGYNVNRVLTCTVGVMAYNEAANIQYLLSALGAQRLATVALRQIIVVASGCTDRTAEIVKRHAESDPRVRLLVQDERKGKASAINLFLKQADADIVVLESGDTIPEADTIENLLRPFHDPGVGMTGAHPVPVNPADTFIGYVVNLYWRLHHEIALTDPKLGEMVAFRDVVREIPENTAVDEASIEAIITAAGFRIEYAWNAIVRNKGAETVRDFLRQRRRVTAGHKHLQATRNYKVSTMKWRNLTRLGRQLAREAGRSPGLAPWIAGAVGLEFCGRVLGSYDYHVKRSNPFVWEIAESTKRLRDDSSGS